MDHLIQVLPYVSEFQDSCRGSGKQVHLVTNAPKTLAIKMNKTSLGGHFDLKKKTLMWSKRGSAANKKPPCRIAPAGGFGL